MLTPRTARLSCCARLVRTARSLPATPVRSGGAVLRARAWLATRCAGKLRTCAHR
jgi:hypothetical protein